MVSLLVRFLYFRRFVEKVVAVKKTLQCICLFLMATITHAQEVKLYSGCNVVLNGSVYVVVNNTAFSNNGVFSAGASTVVFTGTVDTAVANISGTSNTIFNNLTLNKSSFGLALKSSIGVKNILTLSAGNFYANTRLTLLSDVVNTARLAVVPSGANIFGTAMVERYIPSKRAWRLMTGPVTGGATIYSSWQNAGVYTVGKGLLVSGPGGGAGMDNGNAASLKTWNVSTQVLVSVLNTNVSISKTNTGSADNTGYFVFIRGDRNPINFNGVNTNITTLTTIGKLQTGTQTFAASTKPGGFTLIGNPYASPIDFNLVTRNNLVKRFYIWDPTLNSVGGYVTMDDINNDNIYSKSASSSAQTSQIQSSQAFFVETDVLSGVPSITINESAKSSTNNLAVFRPVGGTPLIESLRADLLLLNTDGTTNFADGALAEFGPGYTDNVTNEDALKFSNVNENVSFLRHGISLSIERRPLIALNDTLFLKITNTSARSYQWKLIPENISTPGLSAYLQDSYLATSTIVSLSDTVTIPFAVNANVASAATNRFRIVFKRLSVLPVVFTTLKAHEVNTGIQVDWQVAGEINTLKYEVEKSANGISFTVVNTIAANASGTYSLTDVAPFNGKNFYRIKSTDHDGIIKYSQIVYVLINTNESSFTINPNPVTGNSIHLQFTNQPKGDYQFNLLNNAGQLVLNTSVYITAGSTSTVLKTTTSLPPGLYQLQISGPANKMEVQKLIISQ
ncbi:MAG: hypothetical protein ABIX01_08555 [Chitinophagaceae bacterium]